ncbi:glycine cleavage system transcriptional repressor [Aliiglaciecola sp. LCG003]|uniref:glycine cleavage system protein R n=1 Tax=Aliiglaciecola sp. LCG003 TaxID=3053655 RepID=UPI0025741AC5|nr:glycine cleavage system transcriptional repressor [Aliiglaciecola sp. LCG003]WJG11148.1 ACT domain-containing protein [Aliiglaciecola sp. LCG003]
MKQQLIVTFLGANNVGILSEIANAVSDSGCNILDSRQAIYGEDFSLTMILEGNQTAVTKAEIKLPQTCQRLDLLSMMKRTKRHCKQNLEHLIDVEVSGDDTPGVVHKISSLLAQYSAAISALRQNTFTDQDSQKEKMKIKFVASVPQGANVSSLQTDFNALLDNMGLTGKISENH